MRQRRVTPTDRPEHPTRLRLVEATARQIRLVGYEQVNFDAVLEDVGATKGALYHHFESLHELQIAGLILAFEEGVRESTKWSMSLRNDSHSAADARQRLRDILGESQTGNRGPLRSLRLHALSLVNTEPLLASRVVQLQSELNQSGTETFRELQNRGWIRADADPHVLAVLIQALTLGRIVDDVVDHEQQMDVSAWRVVSEAIFDHYFIVE